MVRAILAGVAVILVAVAAVPANEPVTSIRIGMVQGMFRDVQPGLVQVMSRPLQDIMTRQTGLNGTVDICPDAFALAGKLKEKTLQIGVFHGFEYAWVSKENPDLVPLLVTVPAGRRVAACVMVQKDSPLKNLSELEEEFVTVPRGAKAHTLLYLERQRVGFHAKCAAPKTVLGMSAEDALDAVVTGDSKACLVDAAALTGYQSIQPGAFKQLRVLCQSGDFPPAVIAYRRGAIDEATVAKVKESMLDAHKQVIGKPLLALWNLKGFEDVPADYTARLEAIRKAYPPPAGK